MRGEDLATLAADLKKEGFEARNLGRMGISIWEGSVGHYYPLAELQQNASLVARRDFHAIRREREEERDYRERRFA
jgi:hypothetical protein